MCLSAFGVSAFAANYDSYKDADTVKTDYAKNETAIDVVTGLGIINGDDGYLNLGNGLTRAEAAKILAVVDLGTKTAASVNSSTVSTGYTDMSGHWSSGYVAYCTTKNFLAGHGDGTFEPDGPLTGYAFGKMMLNVLGYGLEKKLIDGTNVLINDYTGDLWETKVLVDATKIDLFADVEGDPSSEITRADAMQMVYNALKNAVSAETPAKDENGYYDVAAEFEIRFESGTPGAYGRPSTIVYVDGKGGTAESYDKDKDVTLTTYTNKLVETFTSKVTEANVFDAIGAEGIQGVHAKYIVMDAIYNDGVKVAASTKIGDKDYEADSAYTDGFNDTVIIAKGDKSNAAGFGNGVTVEVYETVDANHYIMVAYREYFGEVAKVTKADENTGTKRSVTIAGMSFESETLNKKDSVLYTLDNGKIATAKVAANVVEGAISKITSSGVYTIGGTEYELSQTSALSLTVGTTSRAFYTDSYGYIIAEKNAAPAVTYYGYVLDYAKDNGTPASNMTGRPASDAYERVKMVTSEGKEVIFDTAFTLRPDGVTIDENVVDTDVYDNSAIVEHLVSYTLNADGKIASITAATATAGLSGSHLKGAAFAVTDSGALANDKTVIFVAKTNATEAKDVAVYVGYANVPGYSYTAGAAIAAQPNDGGALAVTVSDLPSEAKPATAYFATAAYEATQAPNGNTVYTYTDVYVDGIKTSVVMNSNTAAAAETVYTIETDVNTGLSTLKDGKAVSDATAVTASASGYFVAGSTYYVDSKTVYYQITKDGVEAAESLPGLNPDITVKVVASAEGASANTPATYVYFTVEEK